MARRVGEVRSLGRTRVTATGLLLLVAVLTGCSSSVPHAQHDAVQIEFAAPREKIAALEAQVQRAEADGTAAADRARLTRACIDALNELVLPALEGQTPSASLAFTWRDKIVAVGDPEPTKRSDAMTAAREPQQASCELFSYLLRSTASGIQ